MKYLVLSFFLLFFGCSSKNIIEENFELKKFLQGNWTADNYESLSFNLDGSFTDTLWQRIPYQKSRPAFPLYIVKGKYKVEGNKIHFYDADFMDVRATAEKEKIVFAEIIYPRNVVIDGEDIFLQRISLLHPNDEGQHKLKGEWETKNWICAYLPNEENVFRSGMINEIFSFIDSSKCIYERDYLFDSGQKDLYFTTKYDYDKPRIYFHNKELEMAGFLGSLVGMENGKMIFYHSDAVLFKKN